MFLKDFASKNQLPGFYISGRLVENGLSEIIWGILCSGCFMGVPTDFPAEAVIWKRSQISFRNTLKRVHFTVKFG